MDRTSSRPRNSDHDLFLRQVWLCKVLWSFFLFQPLSWSLLVSCKIHFSSQITIWLRNGWLLCRIREEDTSEWWFFFEFSVSSWNTDLLSFHTFSICFKYWKTIEWLTLSSLATSHVVIRGSALMMALNSHCQLLRAGHYTSHLQGACLLCKTSGTTSTLYVH